VEDLEDAALRSAFIHFCTGGGFRSFRTYFRYFHGRFPSDILARCATRAKAADHRRKHQTEYNTF